MMAGFRNFCESSFESRVFFKWFVYLSLLVQLRRFHADAVMATGVLAHFHTLPAESTRLRQSAGLRFVLVDGAGSVLIIVRFHATWKIFLVHSSGDAR